MIGFGGDQDEINRITAKKTPVGAEVEGEYVS